MTISSITFGKKIPIAKCQIQNRKTGKFEPAMIFEIDCKDESDIEEIENLKGSWIYSKYIKKNMERKFYYQKRYNQDDGTNFYFLENKKGETLGISQTEETYENVHDLTYLDTELKRKYKYVGQTLLATTAREIRNKNAKRFTINNAIDSAFSFYEQECQIPCLYGFFLSMTQDEMTEFIDRTEKKIKAPIINLKE